jgi:hypothetical protein
MKTFFVWIFVQSRKYADFSFQAVEELVCSRCMKIAVIFNLTTANLHNLHSILKSPGWGLTLLRGQQKSAIAASIVYGIKEVHTPARKEHDERKPQLVSEPAEAGHPGVPASSNGLLDTGRGDFSSGKPPCASSLWTPRSMRSDTGTRPGSSSAGSQGSCVITKTSYDEHKGYY